jgi:lipid-A-disaccharide synthase
MVAGEASGDLIASLLLAGLRQRWPGLQAAGIGGPRMAQQGFEAWWPHEKLAVRGYVEVLRHYREIVGIRDALAQRLLAERPDVFVGVDAPDFNLDLEARLRRQGIKTVHFVSPSIWAWRGKRIERIGDSVDLMLCLFPFEPALYAAQGIRAAYVGHPLADAIDLNVAQAPARQVLGLPNEAQVVALLPGSRRSEIRYNAPRMLDAAIWMSRQRPELRFVMPVVPGLESLLAPMLQARQGQLPGLTTLAGRSHEALAACDVTLIASGTATLEAALFKKPMVITYTMNALSWQLMKRMKYQPWVGLPNILAREFLVPELLQGDASPQRLGSEVLAWLDAPQRCAQVAERFHEIHLSLRRNTAQAATDAIQEIIGR